MTNKLMNLKNNKRSKAQATIEFTFSMIIIVLLMYALVKAFRWAGMDLAERRAANDKVFALNIIENWAQAEINTLGPGKQLVGDFYRTKKMGLVFNKW